MEKGRTQSLHFRSNFDPPFFLEAKIEEKEEVVVRKNVSHWAIHICQNQGSNISPLSGKNTITFCTIWAIFGRKQSTVTSHGVRTKIWYILFHLHKDWSTSCKKKLVSTLFSFAATDCKEFLSLAAFLGTTPTFLKKISQITWCRI